MQFSIIALTAAFASLVSALTVPGGSSPSGNSISQPNSTQIVPVGSPFTITWTPTTVGTISLVLLQGPSTNVLPILYIAHNISNSGTYQWMVPTSLAPDTTHYGIELIVDDSQAYQYTSQFGISNPSYASVSSASSASTLTSTSTSTSISTTTSSSSTTSSPAAILIVTSTTNASTSTSTSTSSPAALLIVTSTMNASASPSSSSNSTTYHAPSSGPASASSSPASASSSPASASSSTTIVSGTKTVVVPITMQTSAAGTATAAAGGSSTTSKPAVAQATGAAGRVVVAAGGALAGMGAVVALLL